MSVYEPSMDFEHGPDGHLHTPGNCCTAVVPVDRAPFQNWPRVTCQLRLGHECDHEHTTPDRVTYCWPYEEEGGRITIIGPPSRGRSVY